MKYDMIRNINIDKNIDYIYIYIIYDLIMTYVYIIGIENDIFAYNLSQNFFISRRRLHPHLPSPPIETNSKGTFGEGVEAFSIQGLNAFETIALQMEEYSLSRYVRNRVSSQQMFANSGDTCVYFAMTSIKAISAPFRVPSKKLTFPGMDGSTWREHRDLRKRPKTHINLQLVYDPLYIYIQK